VQKLRKRRFVFTVEHAVLRRLYTDRPLALALLTAALATNSSPAIVRLRHLRAAIESGWRSSPGGFVDMTSDSLGAGLPQRGRYVEAIEVVSGMIVITYGGEASGAIAGRVLAIVPALDSQRALAWACGYGQPPAGFEIVYENPGSYSDIDQVYVPPACRSPR